MKGEEDHRMRLARMIMSHPDLPVVPMVDHNVTCGAEWGRWEGSIGKSLITRYLKAGDMGLSRSEMMAFNGLEKDMYFWEDEIYDMADMLAEVREISDDEAERQIRMMPWKEAIQVYIEVQEGM